MRATGAAAEGGGYAGACERVLQEAQILTRRAQQHGHLVEAHAAARLVEQVPRDFHGLAPFARCRKEDDLGATRREWRLSGFEQVPAKPLQFPITRIVIQVRGDGELLERFTSGPIV
jgi:hypothetical protein